jgi:hypothetical protein
MEGATLLVGQVVAFVIKNEVDHGAVRQGRRFVKDQTALLDTRPKTTHGGVLYGFQGVVRKVDAHGKHGLCPPSRRSGPPAPRAGAHATVRRLPGDAFVGKLWSQIVTRSGPASGYDVDP